MKKIISVILITLLLSSQVSNTYSFNWATIKVVSNQTQTKQKIDREDIFNFLATFYDWKTPNSYKYIKVNYLDVKKGSQLEDSLQKLIYLDLIENPKISLKIHSKLNAYSFYKLVEKTLWTRINGEETNRELLRRYTDKSDLEKVKKQLWEIGIKINSKSKQWEIAEKLKILNDVYKTIIWWHYDKDNLDEWKIIDSAIEWITNWTEDKHTVYFPPIESESFQDSLSWDYEWIWSYVDMEKPWAVRIVSPIPWSPSEKAWIKGWDLVIKVDGREITNKNSLKEVITWIKGPAWTKVTLTIDRGGKIFDIDVIRERIIITDIESEVLNSTTYYLQIKSFWEHVSDDFEKFVDELKKNKSINKIIIDLRNNWWGYLTEVAEILSYFVEEDKKTAIVKYHDKDRTFLSKWYDDIDFSKYRIVVLQNSWTASASEILIWTLKDYFPKTTLIWENTYWKWSVQVMRNYKDWSLLKYTVAKWFTGWTEKAVDWVWIQPDIELEFDLDNYKKNWFDNQLDKAKFIR